MRMRKKWWAIPTLYDSGLCYFWPEDHKGKWHCQFHRKQNLHLDIGCGSGDFSLAMANQHPEWNFILWDRETDVLVYTLANLQERNLSNVKLIAREIECLENVFEKDEVHSITIHFPNPWPKNRHNKRRLTYPDKLNIYKKILHPEGEIDFRTDDGELYEDTLRYIEEVGGKILFSSENAPATTPMSHYESRFREQSISIKTIRFTFGS
ncbi:MAG: tRNA (guanosine(46)-N7)-methyltransferase TrmB [Tissierellia bacterium]|nr:tRNA (guanosine(46)-N7)-methyltransferase TrmB [Tissierellia bacterium]